MNNLACVTAFGGEKQQQQKQNNNKTTQQRIVRIIQRTPLNAFFPLDLPK